MSWKPPDDDDAGSDDDIFVSAVEKQHQQEDDERYAKGEAVIFLIDCGPDMHVKEEGQSETFLQLAIRLAAKTIRDKIIIADDELVGVIFYGTDKKMNGENFDHVCSWGALAKPDGPRIKELNDLHDSSDITAHLGKPLSGPVNFHFALWACNNMFSKACSKDDEKRIMIFTNNDNPCGGDLGLQRQAERKAKDLADNEIDIELYPKHAAGKPAFNLSNFFHKIVTTTDPDEVDGDASANLEAVFANLEEAVLRKKHKRRSQGRLTLELAPGVKMGVKLFALVRESKKGSYVLLDARNGQEIATQTQWVCEGTGSLLQAQEIGLYTPFGAEGDKVRFKKEELAAMKHPYETGLKLIGFQSRSTLRLYQNTRPSNFLYPAEDVIRGSNKCFTAIHTSCLKKDKIAIVCVTPRANAQPRYAALVAQQAGVEVDESTPIPAGFNLVWLPFAEDIRHLVLPEVDPELVTEEASAATAQVVQALKLGAFDSSDFENPVLQQHYACLQYHALNEDDYKQIEDVVVPDEEGFEKHKDKIIAMRDALFPGGMTEAPMPKAPKRKAPEGGYDMRDMVTTGKIAKLTVADLKDWCKDNGLGLAGKKQDLIDRISDKLGV